jgi:hypothetical protein
MLPEIERKLDEYVKKETITRRERDQLWDMIEEILKKREKKHPKKKHHNGKVTISKEFSFEFST